MTPPGSVVAQTRSTHERAPRGTPVHKLIIAPSTRDIRAPRTARSRPRQPLSSLENRLARSASDEDIKAQAPANRGKPERYALGERPVTRCRGKENVPVSGQVSASGKENVLAPGKDNVPVYGKENVPVPGQRRSPEARATPRERSQAPVVARAIGVKAVASRPRHDSTPTLPHDLTASTAAATPPPAAACTTPEPSASRTTPPLVVEAFPVAPVLSVPPSPWTAAGRLSGRTLQECVSSLQREVDTALVTESPQHSPVEVHATLVTQGLHRSASAEAITVPRRGRTRVAVPGSSRASAAGPSSPDSAGAPSADADVAKPGAPRSLERARSSHSLVGGSFGQLPRLRLSSGSGVSAGAALSPQVSIELSDDTERGSVNKLVDQACARTTGLLAALRHEAASDVKALGPIISPERGNKKEETSSPASGSSGVGNMSSTSTANFSCGRFASTSKKLAQLLDVLNFHGQENHHMEHVQRQMHAQCEVLGAFQSKIEGLASSLSRMESLGAFQSTVECRLAAMEQRLEELANEATERHVRSSRSSPCLSTRSLGPASSGLSFPSGASNSDSGSITMKAGASGRTSTGAGSSGKVSPIATCSSGRVSPVSECWAACARPHSAPGSRRCASPAGSASNMAVAVPAPRPAAEAACQPLLPAARPVQALRRCQTAMPDTLGTARHASSNDVLVKVQDLPPAWHPKGHTVWRSRWQVVRPARAVPLRV